MFLQIELEQVDVEVQGTNYKKFLTLFAEQDWLSKNIIQQSSPLKKHVTCQFDHRHNILKKCKNVEEIIFECLSETACQLVLMSTTYLLKTVEGLGTI